MRSALVIVLVLAGLVVGVYAVRRGASSAPTVDPADAIVAKGGRVLYVAPEGAASGLGTKDKPLDLATALSPKGPAQPGDTIWLRGGTYRGIYVSYLSGTEEAPITIETYPGERATIDSSPEVATALAVMGPWTTFKGIEIMNSDAVRVSSAPGSSPADQRRGTGVEVRGPHSKVVNMVVHDMAGGMGIWSDAIAAEAYGNIVYYNGWSAPDRNHGHGIYTQNQTGERRIEDNIVFGQVGYGLHIYGSEAAYLDNVILQGNIIFNNGIINEKGYERNILLGGGRVAQNPVIRNNYTYYSPNLIAGSESSRGERWGGENNIGYAAGCTNLDMQDNYFAHWGGGEALMLTKCTGTIRNNIFYGLIGGDIHVRETYPDNSYLTARPTGIKIVVRPNKYEAGRGHIVVYNWDLAKRVSVDLATAGVAAGARFEIRDAQNFFGDPIVTGTYTGGNVTIPMGNSTTARPIGLTMRAPASSAPEFAAFVVVPAFAAETIWQRLFGDLF